MKPQSLCMPRKHFIWQRCHNGGDSGRGIRSCGWIMRLLVMSVIMFAPTTHTSPPPTPHAALPFPHLLSVRVGEARHPGPPGESQSAGVPPSGYRLMHDFDNPEADLPTIEPEACPELLHDEASGEYGYLNGSRCADTFHTAAHTHWGEDLAASATASDAGVMGELTAAYAAAAVDSFATVIHASNWLADSDLTLEQLSTWRSQELKYGLTVSPPARSSAPPENPCSSLSFSDGFAAASNFIGHISGYHFGLSQKGLGYHTSSPSVPPAHPARRQLVLHDLIPPSAAATTTVNHIHAHASTEWRSAHHIDDKPTAKRPSHHIDDKTAAGHGGDSSGETRREASTSLGDSAQMQRSQLQQQSKQPYGPFGSTLSRRQRRGFPRSSYWAHAEPGTTPQHGIDISVPKIGRTSERWWAKKGLWAIDSFNANAWSSAAKRFLAPANSDVCCLQETKLSPENCFSATSTARKIGWSAVHNHAWMSNASKGSGGASVAARKGVGIVNVSEHIVQVMFRYRICVSWISGIIPGGLYIISVYLRTAEGLSPENMLLIEELGAIVRALDAPWVAAGDWNIQPDTMLQANIPAVLGGCIHAPAYPTCNENVYDYFIVAATISHMVSAVQRLDDGAANPHFPVRLLIRASAKRLMVRRIRKPDRVSPVLPHGPQSRPPSYEDVLCGCREGSDNAIDSATVLWYKHARGEWTDMAGRSLSNMKYSFVWQPLVTKKASDQPCADRLANTWFALASCARETKRLMQSPLPTPDRTSLIASTLARALKLHWSLPKKLRQTSGPSVYKTARSLANSVMFNAPHWSHALAAAATKRGDEVVRKNCQARTKEWREILACKSKQDRVMQRPSAIAFRWLKCGAGWMRSPLGPAQLNDGVPGEQDEELPLEEEDRLLLQAAQADTSEVIPLADQAAVEQECNTWAELWGEGKEYPAPVIPQSEIHPLSTLTVQALRQAALSFPPGTGLGVDNIAPQAIARLSVQALLALSALFSAFELRGSWAAILNLVMIVLLPKNDGGLRPIGLFPTLVRIWMRARIFIARSWEIAHHLPSVYGGTAMGAHRAAWNECFSAELAANVQSDHLQALVDLVKCFETVPHEHLIAAARARGFPLILLRLSLAAYRLCRVISIDGNFSRLVIAIRGITAGSGFATTELRVLLYDVMVELKTRWSPTLSATAFVDDLTLCASGRPCIIIKIMNRALAFLIHVLQDILKMKVSPKKSLALSGRPTISRSLVSAMPQKALTQTRTARLLGADNSAGRRRSTKVVRGRIAMVKRSIGKFQKLRRLGVCTRTLARASATARSTYAADAMGVSDTTLHSMRVASAAAVAAPNSGKSPDLILLTADLEQGSVDPAFAAHQTPVKHWALAWWESWQSVGRLKAAYLAASAKISRARASPWQVATGPAAGFILTLKRLNWTPGDVEVVDDIGCKWNFTRDSPSAIVSAVHRSVKRWRANRVAQLIPDLLPQRPDVALPGQDRYVTLPVVAPLSGLLHKVAPPRGVAWSKEWSSSLCSAICGGQWPQARRACLKGFQGSSSLCQLCLSSTGTLQHRLV